MRRLVFYISIYITTTASTCGSLNIDTVVIKDIHTQSNSVFIDSSVQIEFKATHGHAINKHTGLIFSMLLINKNSKPIQIKPLCIHIHSEQILFNLTATDISYNNNSLVNLVTHSNIKDTTLRIMPDDTLSYQNIYSSSFRGTYKDFKDTLKSAKVFFNVDNIYIEENEITLKNLELVPVLGK